MLKVLPTQSEHDQVCRKLFQTHARTLEKSVDGDITKLSLLLDHEIRFCILWSSNMLRIYEPLKPRNCSA